jgi:hypothetical protein
LVSRLCVWCALFAFLLGTSLAQDTTPPPPAPEPQNQEPQTQQPQNQQPQPQTPETPASPENKDETKKDQSPAEKARQAALDAAAATEKVGALALNKAVDWETGWFTGAYVKRGHTRVPMTDHQRTEIYLQQTFTMPSDYVKRMFLAGFDQARDVPYQWGGGWAGYGDRFASREGQFIFSNSVAALGNAKLKYEPRYDQCLCAGFRRRTWHAVMRNFLTYNQTETELRPQWALYGGAFAGGMLSTSWKPGNHNVFAEGGYAALEQAWWGATLNVFIEFLGEINHKLGSKK